MSRRNKESDKESHSRRTLLTPYEVPALRGATFLRISRQDWQDNQETSLMRTFQIDPSDLRKYLRKNKGSVELVDESANDYSVVLLNSIPMTFPNGFITPWVFKYSSTAYTSIFAPEWCIFSPSMDLHFLDYAVESATPEGVEEAMAARRWHQSRPLGCAQLHDKMRKAWFTQIPVYCFPNDGPMFIKEYEDSASLVDDLLSLRIPHLIKGFYEDDWYMTRWMLAR
jgi:hypothetical protein